MLLAIVLSPSTLPSFILAPLFLLFALLFFKRALDRTFLKESSFNIIKDFMGSEYQHSGQSCRDQFYGFQNNHLVKSEAQFPCGECGQVDQFFGDYLFMMMLD